MTDDLEHLINDLRGPDFWQAFTHGGGALSDRQSSAPFRAADAIARLRAENEALKRAAVTAALPLEALLLVGNVREQHSPELWEGIEEGAQAVRTALQEGSRHE